MPLDIPNTPKTYTTKYSDLKGVDLTNDPSTVYYKRSPYALNMIPDDGGVPYKRTGWKSVYTPATSGKIRYMWGFDFGGDSHLIYTKNNKVLKYGYDETALITMADSTNDPVGVYFNAVSGSNFYMLEHGNLWKYEKNNTTYQFSKFSEPTSYADGDPNDTSHIYIPTTTVGIEAGTQGGTTLDKINLLTRRRINTFYGNGTATDFYTDGLISTTQDIRVSLFDEDTGSATIGTWVTSSNYSTATHSGTLTVNGTTYTFTLDTVNQNKITISGGTIPTPTIEAPNFKIDFYADGTNEASEAFSLCTSARVFNNRVFFTGTPTESYKSYVWYSEYENILYIPDLNYFVVGDNYTGIMGLVDLGDYLGVVKQSNQVSSTIFLAYAITYNDETTYVVKQSITGVGAISKKAFNSLNGEQMFLSHDGIYGLTAYMADESDGNYTANISIKNRSYYINGQLLRESDLDEAISVIWNGFYILCVNTRCYILDGTQKSSWATDRTNLQYECYYWENVPATAFTVIDDTLYFGTATGKICQFKTTAVEGSNAYSDDGVAIQSEWRTIVDNDGATNYFKNLSKKGCCITLQDMKRSVHNSTCDIYVKPDDEDEIYVGTLSSGSANVPQDFYPRKKVKKYIRLQIIIRNNQLNEAFGVQEITKCYTLGNYAKRKDAITLFVDEDSDLYAQGKDSAIEGTTFYYDANTGKLEYEEEND